jgi:hypothetical protein
LRVRLGVTLTLALVVVLGPVAGAVVGPRRVVGGPADQYQGSTNGRFLVWTQNSSAHPRRYDAFIRRVGGTAVRRMNAFGTEGFPGGFDPGSDRVIFEQSSRRDVGIYFYRPDTGKRWKVPGVNTSKPDWQPKISDRFILFQRNHLVSGHWYTDVLLYDRVHRWTRRLATWRNAATLVRTGNVGDRYATYMACTKRRCFSYLYDSKQKTSTKIPTRNGRAQYAPVVDESHGDVYVTRSGNGCGVKVNVWRYDLSLNGPPVKIVDLPDGIDSGWVDSLFLERGSGSADLYFDRWNCTAREGDVYVARGVDSA